MAAQRASPPAPQCHSHPHRGAQRVLICSVVLFVSLLLASSAPTARADLTIHDPTAQDTIALSSKLAAWIAKSLSAWLPGRYNSTESHHNADANSLTFQLDSAVHHSTHDDYLGMSARYPFQSADDDVVSLQHQYHRQKHTYGGIRTKRQRVRRLKDPKSYLSQREELLSRFRKEEEEKELWELNVNAGTAPCGDSTSFHALSASLDSLHTSLSLWEDVELVVPDVTSRLTLLALARMSSAAYEAPPHPPSWLPTDGFEGWNVSDSFGWVENGIRGHVFSNKANKGHEEDGEEIVVVALKGTSAAILPGGDDTAKRDKLNDNLLFSCCCAKVSWTWSPVCPCPLSSSRCSQPCLERSLLRQSVYYPLISDLYNNVSYAYPNAQIWVTGHSLGGALGSLIGYTFGVPSVTFEAPAERMAAKRLHLPLPPGSVNRGDGEDGLKESQDVHPDQWEPPILPITHVFHTADPIPMGTCTGPSSLCGSAGYAMESTCHAGQVVLYNTSELLGWSVNIATHRIATLTDDLLLEDWGERVRRENGKGKGKMKKTQTSSVPWSIRWWPWGRGGKGDGEEGDDDDRWAELGETPEVANQNECVDCSSWRFVDEDKR